MSELRKDEVQKSIEPFKFDLEHQNRVVPTKLHMARIWSTCCWGCKFEECGAKFKLTVVPPKMTPIHYVKLYQDPYQEKVFKIKILLQRGVSITYRL